MDEAARVVWAAISMLRHRLTFFLISKYRSRIYRSARRIGPRCRIAYPHVTRSLLHSSSDVDLRIIGLPSITPALYPAHPFPHRASRHSTFHLLHFDILIFATRDEIPPTLALFISTGAIAFVKYSWRFRAFYNARKTRPRTDNKRKPSRQSTMGDGRQKKEGEKRENKRQDYIVAVRRVIASD